MAGDLGLVDFHVKAPKRGAPFPIKSR